MADILRKSKVVFLVFSILLTSQLIIISSVSSDLESDVVNLFFDDFDDLSLTDKWTVFGDPSPTIHNDLFEKNGLFDNMGDSWCPSGMISRNQYSYDLPCIIETEVYIDVMDPSGCWCTDNFGIIKDVGSGPCPDAYYNLGVLFGLHYRGDACHETPSDERRHAWFVFSLWSENNEEKSYDKINADEYVDKWVTLQIKIDENRNVAYYANDDLIYSASDKVHQDILQNKQLYLAGRSSGSAGKTYNNYFKVFTDEVNTESLVAHWSFDEGSGNNIFDSSGNSITGTIYGPEWANGFSGNALYFDGINDYITFSDSSKLVPYSFTYELWIKPNIDWDEEYQFIVGSCGSNTADCRNGPDVLLCRNGSVRMVICNGDCNCKNKPTIQSETLLENNEWYHVVCTYSGSSNLMSLYINGEFEKSVTSPLYHYPEFYIGGRYSEWSKGYEKFFKGLMDEVKIYNYALPENEIKSNYNELVDTNDQSDDTLNFAGYEWEIKKSKDEPMGPGGNYWSGDSNNVWVDTSGRLHLNLTYDELNNRWYCSEVYTIKSLGYGTYSFYLDSRVDNLPDSVVVGLFTYENRGESGPKEYEIDIEFSTWNNETITNSQYVYQNRTPDSNLSDDDEPNKVAPYRFNITQYGESTTHKFIWEEDYLKFESYHGHYENKSDLPTQNHLIAETEEWNEITKGYKIPLESNEKLHINIWCYKGITPPSGSNNPDKYELIIKDFKFSPKSDDQSINNNENNVDNTPGFEVFIVIITFILAFIYKRNKRLGE